MKQELEYSQCSRCEFIEDCPHPTVNQEGRPIPPTFCTKRDKIKLIRRIDELIPNGNTGI
jgi:hypothetical protein